MRERLRVLHAAVSMNPSVGVVKQMEWEQQAAYSLGIPWKVALHTPKNICSPVVVLHDGLPRNKLGRYLSLRSGFSRWLRKESDGFDLVLLRHSVHDVFESSLASKLGPKLLTVHHTLEIPELKGSSPVWGPLKAMMEFYTGRKSLLHCAGIIGVTDEILGFERLRAGGCGKRKPGFVYPNGVMVSSQSSEDARGDCPEFLFVAAHFSDWHGLDVLLDAMSIDPSPCILRIVGSVPDSLAERCRNDARIHLHGVLGSDGVASLMRTAWCGLSSFALHRKKMLDACTLKVREYLDRGLPVYAGHRDAGLPSDFPYFRQGPANLGQMVEFANSCRKFSRDTVRESATPHIDKRVLLAKLYEGLRADFSITTGGR